MTRFTDRRMAGLRLAERLLPLSVDHPVVIAMPRGGVPVAFEIARALDAVLDVVVVRKIGAPSQPEFALGALVDGEHPEIVFNPGILERLDVPTEYLRRVIDDQLREARRRETLYRRGRPPIEIAGRTVILVDDGIATGATTRAAIRGLARRGPGRIVLAVPVAPAETLAALEPEVDAVVCLHAPPDFGSVGSFYDDFRQTTDEEVVELLERAAPVEP